MQEDSQIYVTSSTITIPIKSSTTCSYTCYNIYRNGQKVGWISGVPYRVNQKRRSLGTIVIYIYQAVVQKGRSEGDDMTKK
jgi:hypothetical protein